MIGKFPFLLAPILASSFALSLLPAPAAAQSDNGFFVTANYMSVLDRLPDPGGWAYWLYILNNGLLDRTTLSYDFINSQEYANDYGPTGTSQACGSSGAPGSVDGFLRQLYWDALLRCPGSSDLAYWESYVPATYSEAQTVNLFIYSQEFASDGQGATAAAYHSAYADPSTMSLNGAAGGEQTLTVNYTDSDGAGFISYGQIVVNADTGPANGSNACYVVWDSTGDLILTGGTQNLYGNIGQQPSTPLTNAYCTVDPQNSTITTNGITMTVNLAVTFAGGFAGTHEVYSFALNTASLNSGWVNLGYVITGASPPPPTVTLTDTTQNSGYYFVGDSFILTVQGVPGQPVTVVLNGVNYGQQGRTDPSTGVYTAYGTWTSINLGTNTETWYVEGVATSSPLTFAVQVPPGTPVITSPVYQPPPGSAPAPNPPVPVTVSVTNCNDISGNWTDPAGNVTSLDENTSSQSGPPITGTLAQIPTADPWYPLCELPIVWTVTGAIGPPFSLTNNAPTNDACGYPLNPNPTTATISVTITSCLVAQVTGMGITGSGSPSSQYMPLATGALTSWTRGTAAGMLMTADLSNDSVNLTLTGQNKTGPLSVVINGVSPPPANTPTATSIAQVGSAAALLTPSYGLSRLSLSPGQYSSVVATWDDITVTVPVSFYVVGNTLLTQYNTQYASNCTGTPQLAYVINGMDATMCYAIHLNLPSGFITGVAGAGNGTGTGVAQIGGVNQVLKSYNAGAKNICTLPTPQPGVSAPNADGSNTFFSVDAGGNRIQYVTGSHNTVLSDGTGSPSPLNNNNPPAGGVAVALNGNQPAFPFVFGDQILLVGGNDVNDMRGPRSVEDLCSHCGVGTFSSPDVAHIDMYNSSQACSGIGNYVTGAPITTIRLR